ncbi:uncharacterized protein Dana_GF10848 [Drosophila ananassae]|uniref:DNA repair protein SWI5 homolog n=1 Tax=Drosophila ananassae TaxID=7217 RepID=B3M8U8_DROAN|nr:DNA repair protein SWI5 homolog [Drosophila ananassae]EDV41099.1 uncharacterized protein Dana_GF10848 [Drosophila ananassae]
MKNSKKKPRKNNASKRKETTPVDENAVSRQKETIELLHEYNDLKDATQIVLGALATMKGVPVRSLYASYNLPIVE